MGTLLSLSAPAEIKDVIFIYTYKLKCKGHSKNKKNDQFDNARLMHFFYNKAELL